MLVTPLVPASYLIFFYQWSVFSVVLWLPTIISSTLNELLLFRFFYLSSRVESHYFYFVIENVYIIFWPFYLYCILNLINILNAHHQPFCWNFSGDFLVGCEDYLLKMSWLCTVLPVFLQFISGTFSVALIIEEELEWLWDLWFVLEFLTWDGFSHPGVLDGKHAVYLAALCCGFFPLYGHFGQGVGRFRKIIGFVILIFYFMIILCRFRPFLSISWISSIYKISSLRGSFLACVTKYMFFLLFYFIITWEWELGRLCVFQFFPSLFSYRIWNPPPPPTSFAAFFLLSPSFQRMFLLALCPCLPAARAFRLQPRFAATSESSSSLSPPQLLPGFLQSFLLQVDTLSGDGFNSALGCNLISFFSHRDCFPRARAQSAAYRSVDIRY